MGGNSFYLFIYFNQLKFGGFMGGGDTFLSFSLDFQGVGMRSVQAKEMNHGRRTV